jgi:hypothetical protein
MKRVVSLLACAFALLPVWSAAEAQEKAQPAMFTRFYDVSQLIVAKPQYPFTGSLPASSARTSATPSVMYGGGIGGSGLGGGGIGGAGAAASGGGGFFSIPSGAPQFGGGMGGMGGGGVGGGGFDLGTANPAAAAENMFIMEYSAEGIAGLLVENVATESWADMGGLATVTALGNTLLIRQTEDNHKQIRDFLNQLTAAVVGVEVYQLEAWWVPAAAAERRQLDDLLRLASEQPDWRAAISSLTESAGGFHGRLLCRERITAHLASGVRRPLVVGSIPVVGGSSSLSQPIVHQVNIGLILEATVVPVPEYLSRQGEDAGDHDEVYVNLRSAITSDQGKGSQSVKPGEIDRFEIGANVVESGIRVNVGTPTLAGTLTSIGIGPLEGDDVNEAALVIAVTRQ